MQILRNRKEAIVLPVGFQNDSVDMRLAKAPGRFKSMLPCNKCEAPGDRRRDKDRRCQPDTFDRFLQIGNVPFIEAAIKT